MNKAKIIFFLLFIISFSLSVQQRSSTHVQKNKATQIIVSGKLYLILGCEFDNSLASSSADIERVFPKLGSMNLNTMITHRVSEPGEYLSAGSLAHFVFLT